MNNIQRATTNPDPSDAALLRRFYAALDSGDMTTAAALLAPGVVLHVPGHHELAGDYRGLEGVGRFAALSSAVATGGAQVSVLDVMTGDDHVAALCRVEAHRPGCEPLENRTVHLARLEAGRIAEVWYHNFDQHTVDAFWGTRQ